VVENAAPDCSPVPGAIPYSIPDVARSSLLHDARIAGLGCGGYLAHPFVYQMDLLLIASCFSELWHSQMKAYKSISRVYLYHAEHTLLIFSFGGS